MNKRIITFMPSYNLDKIFFEREIWYIWYTFTLEKWYSSEIWTLRKKWQKNFKINKQKWIWFNNKFMIYIKLFLNSPKIDILYIMHISLSSLISTIIYKLRNKKGKIYLKMDSPLIEEHRDMRKKALHIPRFIMNILFKRVDFFWFEDRRLQKFYRNTFIKYSDKFIFTTSWCTIFDELIWNIHKENIISLVWRFGSYQKNNELLLDILEQFEIDFLRGWKIYMCWQATDSFILRLNSIFNKKPILKNIIFLTWFLNKKDLFQILIKSKIFLHTANYEGDPNIQYDAMFCWCFMISTDVANIKQNYPKGYSIFYKIKDKKWLYNSLKKGIQITESFTKKKFEYIQKYSIEHFSWNKSLKQILDRL